MGGAPAQPARARGDGGEVVWEEARLGFAFYRVEGEGEGRLRRWGQVPAVAAIND
jgi:hypothetical protein